MSRSQRNGVLQLTLDKKLIEFLDMVVEETKQKGRPTTKSQIVEGLIIKLIMDAQEHATKDTKEDNN